MNSLSSLKKTFVLQEDKADCGLACLRALTNYHGGKGDLENFREIIGIGKIGSTLLDLYDFANKIGFDAQTSEADIQKLKELEEPCILHVLIEGVQHYVVYYNKLTPDRKHVIGDPAKGIVYMAEEELTRIWESKLILQMKTSAEFVSLKAQSKASWIWFSDMLKAEKNIVIINTFLASLITGLGITTAFFCQQLADEILPSGNHHQVISGLLILFLILLIKSTVSYYRKQLIIAQNLQFSNRVTAHFFNIIVHLPKSFLDTLKNGDLNNRLNINSRIQQNFAHTTSIISADTIVLLSTLVFMASYSFVMLITTLLFVASILCAVFSFNEPIRTKLQELTDAKEANDHQAFSIINGIEFVKSTNNEGYFISKMKDTCQQQQYGKAALLHSENGLKTIIEVLTLGFILVMTAISTFLLFNGQIKTGQIIALVIILITFLPAISRLSKLSSYFHEMNIDIKKTHDISSIEPEYPAHEKEEIQLINFQKLKVAHLSFRFSGRKAIIEDVSFHVKRGETIALLGESGSGKSTIMAILQKLHTPGSGSITVNDQSLSYISTPSWRNIVANVPQDIPLFEGTILDNIAIGSQKKNVHAILFFCASNGFDIFFESLPQGYFTTIGEGGIQLSGGEKQLLALARALYLRPQLLLLDEPTSSMDTRMEKFSVELLNRFKKNMAMILITHKTETTRLADRIYVIKQGKLEDPFKFINFNA